MSYQDPFQSQLFCDSVKNTFSLLVKSTIKILLIALRWESFGHLITTSYHVALFSVWQFLTNIIMLWGNIKC